MSLTKLSELDFHFVEEKILETTYLPNSKDLIKVKFSQVFRTNEIETVDEQKFSFLLMRTCINDFVKKHKLKIPQQFWEYPLASSEILDWLLVLQPSNKHHSKLFFQSNQGYDLSLAMKQLQSEYNFTHYTRHI